MYLLRLALWLCSWSIWRKFHWLLRRYNLFVWVKGLVESHLFYTVITSISLFKCYVDVLSIGESLVLKSPSINVWDSVCDLIFRTFSFTNVDGLAFGIDVTNWIIILMDLSFDEYDMLLHVSFDKFWLTASFVRYYNTATAWFLDPFVLLVLF